MPFPGEPIMRYLSKSLQLSDNPGQGWGPRLFATPWLSGLYYQTTIGCVIHHKGWSLCCSCPRSYYRRAYTWEPCLRTTHTKTLACVMLPSGPVIFAWQFISRTCFPPFVCGTWVALLTVSEVFSGGLLPYSRISAFMDTSTRSG